MQLLKNNDGIIRILKEDESRVFAIDCNTLFMPSWIEKADITCYEECTEEEMQHLT